jgi:phosphorylcholine metabolism protein LicD
MIENIRIILKKNKIVANIIKTILDNTIRKYKKYKRNKIFLKNAQTVLSKVSIIFDELNIQYWLEYGTLLGAIRDKKFIQNDYDIDLGLFLSDYNNQIENIFVKHGFKKMKSYSIDNNKYGLEESYRFMGLDIDLFYFTIKQDTMFTHVFQNEEGKSWDKTIIDNGGLIVREMTFSYNGFIEIDFLDAKYPVPKNADNHLKSFYGKNYMIKDTNWNPFTMAKNVKVLDNKIGVYKSYE